MLLCDYCIEEIKSRGERVKIATTWAITIDECEEFNTDNEELIEAGAVSRMCCEWCGEEDYLNECEF